MEEKGLTDWTQPPRPDWVQAINREGSYLDVEEVVPLDENSLIDGACANKGLTDFGSDDWREPFEIMLQALQDEAQLNLMGRIMARSDIIIWLSTRLQVVDELKRHPEILEQEVEAPMVIVGLPRSGTSILFELLAQDPVVRVPECWEAMFPCPPPEPETYATDPRIEQADLLVTQWSRVVPEFATIHEMRGQIPAECGQIMAGSFVSDLIAALHQIPSYSAWCAEADYLPAYQYHKQVLQILQWKMPGERWLLKAPEHQQHLETLLAVYPDARIVQTHRDPIKCMSSSVSLMGALYYMRSDQPFNAEVFENIVLGEPTAQRLEKVMQQRDSGRVPEANITDSRYQDLMDDPMGCISGIYDYFGIDLTDTAKSRMLAYLESKPKGKFGVHKYTVDARRSKDRPLFKRYQERYGVVDEM